MDDAKYSRFDISEMAYKLFNNQEIPAYILVLKALPSGKYPILATFHGGFHVRVPCLELNVVHASHSVPGNGGHHYIQSGLRSGY
jgi:hypothetical protein